MSEETSWMPHVRPNILFRGNFLVKWTRWLHFVVFQLKFIQKEGACAGQCDRNGRRWQFCRWPAVYVRTFSGQVFVHRVNIPPAVSRPRFLFLFFFLHVARGGCCWLLLKKFFENQPTRRTLLQHRPIVWNGSINRKLTASFGESRNVSKEQNPPKGQRCLTHTHTLSKGKISFGKTTGKPRAGERGGINKFRIFTRPTQKHFFFFKFDESRLGPTGNVGKKMFCAVWVGVAGRLLVHHRPRTCRRRFKFSLPIFVFKIFKKILVSTVFLALLYISTDLIDSLKKLEFFKKLEKKCFKSFKVSITKSKAL